MSKCDESDCPICCLEAEIERLQSENDKLRTPLGRDIELLEDNARLQSRNELLVAQLTAPHPNCECDDCYRHREALAAEDKT